MWQCRRRLSRSRHDGQLCLDIHSLPWEGLSQGQEHGADERGNAEVRSTLADAELALIQEEARAEQAARDWEKIGGDKPASDLVLRVPFLISAKARVTAAIASRNKAKADLDRTKIVAPFDCRVRSVNMNLGATIVPGAQLGTIYDPNNLMIRLPFSLDDYAQLPEKTDVRSC